MRKATLWLMLSCTFVIAACEKGADDRDPLVVYDNFRRHAFRDEPDDHAVPLQDSSSAALARAITRIVSHKKCPGRLLFHCNVKCDQGRLLMKKSGCCRCTCKRGYFLGTDAKSCHSVRWTAWGTWSTCITSNWGGLQTRERICKRKGVNKNSRCVGAGSESRTCSSVTQPYRIRKNVRKLTDADKHDLIQAYTKFKNDKSSGGFMYTAKWHGWPYECPWYKHISGHSNGHCSWHGHPLFPAWHRLFMIQLELGVNKYLKNKTLGLPYWDWTEKGWIHLPELIRFREVFDPMISKYVKNPFYSTLLPKHKKVYNETVRTIRVPNWKALSWNKILLRSVIRSMNLPTFKTMEDMMEGPHDQIHNCLCVSKDRKVKDLCEFSMLTVSFSAFDPMFALHHSQIDRIYSLYKRLHEAVGDLDWTKTSLVGSYKSTGTNMTWVFKNAFDFPLSPYCNATMNRNPVTLNDKVWTVRNSFYYKQLFGYEYDTFDFDGYAWQGLIEDWKIRQASSHYGAKLPFVSFMAPHLGEITNANTYYKNECSVPPVIAKSSTKSRDVMR